MIGLVCLLIASVKVICCYDSKLEKDDAFDDTLTHISATLRTLKPMRIETHIPTKDGPAQIQIDISPAIIDKSPVESNLLRQQELLNDDESSRTRIQTNKDKITKISETATDYVDSLSLPGQTKDVVLEGKIDPIAKRKALEVLTDQKMKSDFLSKMKANQHEIDVKDSYDTAKNVNNICNDDVGRTSILKLCLSDSKSKAELEQAFDSVLSAQIRGDEEASRARHEVEEDLKRRYERMSRPSSERQNRISLDLVIGIAIQIVMLVYYITHLARISEDAV